MNGRCLAGTIGTLARGVEAGARVEADWPLNVLNGETAEALAGLGAEGVWASPEADRETLSSIAARSPVPVGVSVLGRQELMVAEHCIIGASVPCDEDCAGCGKRVRAWSLQDRKDYRFPVRADGAGRSHIYNPVPLDLTHELDTVLGTGVAMVRLDLALEEPEAAAALTAEARRRLDAAKAGAPVGSRMLDPATSGHFFRGVT
jgi:putative protease